MFPLVHHYFNKAILPPVDHAMILGGMFPDLAINTGVLRDTAHTCGLAFYNWNNKISNGNLNFIKGILSHGADPAGLDYYSDEFWQNGKKGYCFQQGVPWMERVQNATHLPDNLIWWKSHNFVEMSFELIASQKNTSLNQEIFSAIDDDIAIEEVSELVQRFFEVDKAKMVEAYKLVPEIFALADTTPYTLSKKQARSFKIRHNCFDADVGEMAELLTEMTFYFQDKFDPFMSETQKLVQTTINEIIK